MIEIINFVLISGIVINILLLSLLWKQSFNKNWATSKLILFVFFSLTLMVSIHTYAEYHNFAILYVLTYIPAELIEWVLGPLLLLYVRSVFTTSHLFNTNFKLHFTPSLLVLIGLTIPYFISIINGDPIFAYLEKLMEYNRVYVVLRNCYFLFYLIITYRLLLRFQEVITSYYSFNREKELNWIKYLIVGASLITIIDLSSEMYEILILPLTWDSSYITVIFMILFVSYLGYHGVNQGSILLPDFMWEVDYDKLEKEGDRTVLDHKTSARKHIDIDQDSKIALEELMRKEEPFLDENLTLGELAIKLNTTDKKLSHLLNQQMKIGFYDFINEYRIRHFIELVKTDSLKTQTIFSLAQESGFKSKATFNRFFKKQYKITPREYVLKIKNGYR